MTFQRRRWAWSLMMAFAAAAALRLAGLSYGLPHTFNSDEPHLINLAVSFGQGSFNPYSFKYPTLWPTVLFFCYGLYFLLWSGFGLLRGVAEFSALYAWEPTGFYLIGRGLSAALSMLGVLVVWRMEVLTRPKDSWIPWGALLMAFAPLGVSLSHAAKPDCLMFFLVCVAWFAALKIRGAAGRRWYWVCGAAVGLAVSAQYTAGLCGLLLLLGHFLGRRRGKLRWLGEGLAAIPAAFLLGTPYAVLDFPRFYEGIRDFSYLAGLWDNEPGAVAAHVLRNLWNFAGAGSVAGLAVIAGLVLMWRRDEKLAIFAAVPVAAYTAFLMNHPDGGWGRYLLGCYPGLALLASESLNRFPRKPAVTAVLAALAIGPGIYESWAYDRGVLTPDTRTLSEPWVKANIPEGSVLLLDARHAVPRTVISREQLEELVKKTEASGSPRRHLYRAMLQNHPGGGYRVYRIKRSAGDLRLNPKLLEKTQADVPVLDVRPGLDSVRAMRVDYVLTSSFGIDLKRAPEFTAFFTELRREGELVMEFPTVIGKAVGPHIRVYRLRPGA